MFIDLTDSVFYFNGVMLKSTSIFYGLKESWNYGETYNVFIDLL